MDEFLTDVERMEKLEQEKARVCEKIKRDFPTEEALDYIIAMAVRDFTGFSLYQRNEKARRDLEVVSVEFLKRDKDIETFDDLVSEAVGFFARRGLLLELSDLADLEGIFAEF